MAATDRLSLKEMNGVQALYDEYACVPLLPTYTVPGNPLHEPMPTRTLQCRIICKRDGAQHD